MRVITVASYDADGVGRYIGTFTQIKLAWEYVQTVCCDQLYVNLKEADASRISGEMRRNEQSCNLHDSLGDVRFSMLRSELNPTAEGVGL